MLMFAFHWNSTDDRNGSVSNDERKIATQKRKKPAVIICSFFHRLCAIRKQCKGWTVTNNNYTYSFEMVFSWTFFAEKEKKKVCGMAWHRIASHRWDRRWSTENPIQNDNLLIYAYRNEICLLGDRAIAKRISDTTRYEGRKKKKPRIHKWMHKKWLNFANNCNVSQDTRHKHTYTQNGKPCNRFLQKPVCGMRTFYCMPQWSHWFFYGFDSNIKLNAESIVHCGTDCQTDPMENLWYFP